MNAKNYMLMTRLMGTADFMADRLVMGIRVTDSRITLHSANVVSQRGDLSWYQAGYRYPTKEREVFDE